jgi:hypothetical protein
MFGEAKTLGSVLDLGTQLRCNPVTLYSFPALFGLQSSEVSFSLSESIKLPNAFFEELANDPAFKKFIAANPIKRADDSPVPFSELLRTATAFIETR